MFENGEIILYQNGEQYEIGIIKERYDNSEGKECYRVYYHLGDTSALTNATDMKKINNAFMLPEMLKKFGVK